MARYQSFGELKNASATTLAKHLRDELNLPTYTAEMAKSAGKLVMMDKVVDEYRAARLPLPGAEGWPWECDVQAKQLPKERAAAPVAAGKQLTARDQSAAMADVRLKQLIDKDTKMEDLPRDQDGKMLINPMHMTGPGYIHPRFWAYPALPKGQEYRVAVIFDPQGKESTQRTHLNLNGRALIAQRDQIVYLPAEYIDGVVEQARGKIDEGIGANKELDINQNGADLKLRAFRTEYMREIGEVIVDRSGALVRVLRSNDERLLQGPSSYSAAAPMEQPQLGA